MTIEQAIKNANERFLSSSKPGLSDMLIGFIESERKYRQARIDHKGESWGADWVKSVWEEFDDCIRSKIHQLSSEI